MPLFLNDFQIINLLSRLLSHFDATLVAVHSYSGDFFGTIS